MKIAIGTCTYNANELTNNLLRSIKLNSKLDNLSFYIVDNGDKEKFLLDDKNISLFGNEVTIFYNNEELLFKYRKDLIIGCDGDYKHSRNVLFLLDNVIELDFILFDCDTFLLKPIDFVDCSFLTIGSCNFEWVDNRFLPYMQYFNTALMKQHQIKYLDEKSIIIGSKQDNIVKWLNFGNLFLELYGTPYHMITGWTFTNTVLYNKLPYKIIDIYKYIVHCGSYAGTNGKQKTKDFLNKYKI